MNIGQRIKALRELRGLTLEQVGNYLNVNKATVQRYETGDIDIKRTVAIKLSEILNTTPSYIMGWTDDLSHASQNVSNDALEVACAYEKATFKEKNIVRQILDLPLLESPAKEVPSLSDRKFAV
ncbi:XRE family transcriptional regulator [Anaerotruncus sp. X29]|nr:XRE family transcriptional regulator [Anaerotruncus sp. X29]